MSAPSFQKATKKRAKLRAAIFGPSGSGKTFTSLKIANGLGGKIGFIDTERRTACKYSDRFQFDVCELEDKSISGYCAAIEAARIFDVLIIDSLSHGWQELLEQVEKLAQAKYRGNTWSAWSEGTPEQRRLVDAILDFPGHVIATMRSKTEWTTAKQENGKSSPVRVGLAPEQGKGIEYEFDLLLELTVDHVCNVLKDRSGRFQDKLIDKPGEEFGEQLAAWLAEGERVPTKAETEEEERQKRLKARIEAMLQARPDHLDAGLWEKHYTEVASSKCTGFAPVKALSDMSIAELKIVSLQHAAILAELEDAS